MAQTWIPTFKKRLMLGVLDLYARLTQSRHSLETTESAQAIQRVLVIELWNIGDVVLAMPFLAQLRSLFPHAMVTMLARPHAQTVLSGTGLVDEFIATELGWSGTAVRNNPFAYSWSELARGRRQLRRLTIDVAFSGRMHIREHVVLALSGARRRVAFRLGGGRVLTDALDAGDPNRHKVEEWLEWLKPFGGPVTLEAPRLKVSEAERSWAMGFLEARGISTEDRVVGIHPGASIPEKRWPLERFAEVAGIIAAQPATKVLAFVAPDGYGVQLGEVPGIVSARVNLRELMALVECCDVLV